MTPLDPNGIKAPGATMSGMASSSHSECRGPAGHVCQEPSGRTCFEAGCDQPAGTTWGPYWCPAHDFERLERISRGLNEIEASLRR